MYLFVILPFEYVESRNTTDAICPQMRYLKLMKAVSFV